MERGFSLPELLAVLVTTMLVLAMSVPALSSFSSRTRVKEDAEEIQNTLERFINYSIITGKQYEFLLEPPMIVVTDQDGHTVYRSRQMSTKLVGLKPSAHTTLFPSGVASPVTMTIENGSRECSVVVSLRGRTRITC